MSTSTDTSRTRDALGLPGNSTTKVSPKDQIIAVRTQQLDRMVPQLARAAPSGIEADQIARDVLTALRLNDDLWKCTEASLFGGAMTAAQVGLRVGVLGHGWLIPFKNNYLSQQAGREIWEAQWVLGYQGMIELAHRTGNVVNIVAHTIHSKEKYRIVFGAEERIEHEPFFGAGDPGEPVIYYSQAWFSNGGYGFQAETHARMLAFAETLRSWLNTRGPWRTNFEPMAWKTCLRRQFRWMPKTAALAIAFDADEKVTKLEGDQLTREEGDRALLADASPTSPEPTREHLDVVAPAAPPPSSPEAPAEPAASRPRRKQPDSRARTALLAALTEKYGDDRAVATVLVRHVLGGEAVPIDQVTSDELRAALAWRQPQTEQPDPDEDGPADDPEGALIDAAYAAEHPDPAEQDELPGATDGPSR